VNGEGFIPGSVKFLRVNRQQRHDVGYWMSILGFATVVSGALFGSLLSADTVLIVTVVGIGLGIFLLGGEMALRNMEH
jgi:hypothetical protein